MTIKEKKRSDINNFIKTVIKEKKLRKKEYMTEVRALHIYSHFDEKMKKAKKEKNNEMIKKLEENLSQIKNELKGFNEDEIKHCNNRADEMAKRAADLEMDDFS